MKSKAPALLTLFLWSSLPFSSPAQTSEFGSAEHHPGALIGILYDLKQSQKREPVSANIKEFYRVIENFINSGYDEGSLEKYFRSAQALYTTEIFISHRSADFGPKAFNVEKIVKPTFWLAHYKGQVIPPEAGTYEFVASADGFIAVAVNGKSLLVKHNTNSDQYLKQVGREFVGPAANGQLRRSLSFESDGKTPIDLDVLLAEAGGEFNAFLLYRRQGASYQKDAVGNEILPVFQLGAHAIAPLAANLAPKYILSEKLWQAVP